MFSTLKRLLQRFLATGRRPGDDADERVRKTVLTIFSFFVITGLPKQALLVYQRGEWVFAGALGGWSLLSIGALIHFARTGERALLQTLQLGMFTVITAASHVLLGGFEASHGVIIWGALIPVGAMLLCSRGHAFVWLCVYLVTAFAALLVTNQSDAPILVERSQGRILALVALILGLNAGVFILVRYFVGEIDKARHALAEKHAELEVEQAKSEGLLLNILPSSIAERLKDEPETIADDFAEVTVLFADIVGFTSLSARTEPDVLVRMLNEVFSAFDTIAAAHGVEKIKTIGDAYMAASGLPAPQADHAQAVATMALEMRRALTTLNGTLGTDLDIRIGIHTGPVVAGVIGKHKFIYDLWGDTVNVASRMESHGEPGQVQISAATRDHLGEGWPVIDRGEIPIKGKGPMRCYFLDERPTPRR